MKVASKSDAKKELSPVSEYTDLLSQEDRLEMMRLENEIMAKNEEAVTYIQNTHMPPEKNNFDQLNKFIHMQMFSMCLQPLQNGFSPSNLAQGFLMYKTMTLLNKDFRDNVHSTVSRALLPVAEKMANQPGASEKTIQRRDAILREANNGRLPLDEHSAALIRIGICRNSYDMSRQPGANLDEVMNTYNTAMANLEKCMKQDGVDSMATDAEMRTIVGRFARENPDVLNMFAETSYDNVKLSDFHTESVHVLDENGKRTEITEKIWRGEFETPDGTDFTAGFTPRFPNSKEGYETYMKDAMQKKMGSCINGKQLFDTISTGPMMYDSSGRLSSWMANDGFSQEDIVIMQQSAFNESLAYIQKEQPNLFADFSRVYTAYREQQASRSQRGHEFDDMFETGDAQNSAEYY